MTPLCPLDQQALRAIPHGAATYHACPACHGLWLERLFLNNLVERRWIATKHNPPAPQDPVERAAPLSCPACRKTMLHRKNGRVQIDLCPGCRSIWLDGGEIDLLADALPKKQLPEILSASKRQLTQIPDQAPSAKFLEFLEILGDSSFDSTDFP